MLFGAGRGCGDAASAGWDMIVVAALEAPAVVAFSMMSQRWVRRSSSAIVLLASLKTLGHSPNDSLAVTMTEVRSYSRLMRWNKQLATRLGERQIAEFVEDEEVHAGQVIGEPALPTIASLGFRAIDKVDDVEEAGAGVDAAAGNGDSQDASYRSRCRRLGRRYAAGRRRLNVLLAPASGIAADRIAIASFHKAGQVKPRIAETNLHFNSSTSQRKPPARFLASLPTEHE